MSNINNQEHILPGGVTAPLAQALLDYCADAPARFHTPGHKGEQEGPLFPFFGEALRFDLTELPETDSLFEASGVIFEAERAAAEAFGTKETLLSAGGSTLCIQAMLRLASTRGKKVLMARNAHISAVNALCLLGLEPVWVWPQAIPGSSLPGPVSPSDIEQVLQADSDISAVYLTSPNYFGVMADISAISAVCRRHNLPLLVDNAHGSHLLALRGGELHPMRLGAALCCDSAHKTLPALTGGAWLHLSPAAPFDREGAKQAMALFGSTSPSYLVMLSLDLARTWLQTEGAAAFDRLERRVTELHEFAGKLGFAPLPQALFDPCRIVIDTASVGMPGGEANAFMRRHGVSAEMNDDRHVVLLPSPLQGEEAFTKLMSSLERMAGLGRCPLQPVTPDLSERPEAVLLPREAMNQPIICLPVDETGGYIAAQAVSPCPPGIPLVMPGERITPHLAKTLKNYGVRTVNVVK